MALHFLDAFVRARVNLDFRVQAGRSRQGSSPEEVIINRAKGRKFTVAGTWLSSFANPYLCAGREELRVAKCNLPQQKNYEATCRSEFIIEQNSALNRYDSLDDCMYMYDF